MTATLTSSNFLEFAAENYRNPRCLSVQEFFDDVARFKYTKRLLNRYKRTGVIQERLLINHLISIFNVFDIPAAIDMLYYKCDEDTWPALKSCLLYLNHLNEFDAPHDSDHRVDKILKAM